MTVRPDHIRLVLRRRGSERELDSWPVHYEAGEWRSLTVKVEGEEIGITFDDQLFPSYDLTNEVGPSQGRLAIHTSTDSDGEVEFWFDDLSVDLFDERFVRASGGPFYEDFESGDTSIMDLGPAADVICFQDNCVLRHVANRNYEPGSRFGNPSWRDYLLRFRFNIRSTRGIFSAKVRSQADREIVVRVTQGDGLELVTVTGRSEFVVARAPMVVELDAWHELTILVDGTHIELYLDGSLISSHDVPEDRIPFSGSAAIQTHRSGSGNLNRGISGIAA